MAYSPKTKFNKPFFANAKSIEELAKFIQEHLEDTHYKVSSEFLELSRAITQSQKNITIKVNNSNSSSSTASSDIVTVTKSVSANTAYNETFLQPSVLLTLPVCYSMVDGLMSTEFPKLENITINGFKVTPIQNGTLFYSYKYL